MSPDESERAASDVRTADREDHDARRQISAALERAARSDKRVMVVFAADWCADSRALERTFEHHLLVPLLEAGFEVVTLDVGNRDRHREIAEGWGIDYGAGIPAVAILDDRGELVAATTEGELAAARASTTIEVATLVHRWLPESARAD